MRPWPGLHPWMHHCRHFRSQELEEAGWEAPSPVRGRRGPEPVHSVRLGARRRPTKPWHAWGPHSPDAQADGHLSAPHTGRDVTHTRRFLFLLGAQGSPIVMQRDLGNANT